MNTRDTESRPSAPTRAKPRPDAAAQYNPPMDRVLFGRSYAMSLLLLVAAVWSVAINHPQPNTAGFWVGMVLAAVWASMLFWRPSGIWRIVSTAAILGTGVGATLADPAMSTLLMISVGWVGARVPARHLRVYGGPLIVAAALIVLAAGHTPGPLVHLVLTHGFLNLIITLGLVLAFGRLAADNREARAAQSRAFQELQAAHSELQRRADAMEEVAVLRERNRLSRELHDTLGHALSAITVQVEAIRRLLPTDPARANDVLGETQTAARTAMRDLRRHLSALREPAAPPELSDALGQLCAEAAARNGWRAETALEAVELPPAQRRALLQVAREALRNCERHAHAATLRVGLQHAADTVWLTVQDDGCGFDPGGVPADRFGLQGMRERLRELHGELRVDSSPGHGTRIVGMVPTASPGMEAV